MSIQPRNRDDYTVGWVCALPKEQTAAVAMLDQLHPHLPLDLCRSKNDPNTYTLGSIGSHNVVIACLPKGKFGTISAATIVAHMVETFPAIRFGLMVGIGGGISPDVRLGDVVVSVPVYEYPGVVQWDLGIAKDGSQFKRTGSLNSPPTLLLTALSKLETQHDLEGPKMQKYLDDWKNKYPKTAPRYMRTHGLQDVLFEARYSHVENQPTLSWLQIILIYATTVFAWLLRVFHGDTISSLMNSGDNIGEQRDKESIQEETCPYCDKTRVVRRKPRGIRVHQGLVISGNAVIKDAALRDSLNEKFDGHALCVEMEAAGLMDNFPCVVIRGICDYADSHKNYMWQEHAAAISAAFAKELLEYVQPSEVAREQLAKDILHHG